jgi:hypothetical protein
MMHRGLVPSSHQSFVVSGIVSASDPVRGSLAGGRNPKPTKLFDPNQLLVSSATVGGGPLSLIISNT